MRISDWSSDVCSSDLLERAHHAHAGNPGGPLPGDVSPFEDDPPPCRLEEFRQEIEDRRFAGAVRADHRMDAATPDAEVDAIDGNKAGERSRETVGLQDVIVSYGRRLDRKCTRLNSSP